MKAFLLNFIYDLAGFALDFEVDGGIADVGKASVLGMQPRPYQEKRLDNPKAIPNGINASPSPTITIPIKRHKVATIKEAFTRFMGRFTLFFKSTSSHLLRQRILSRADLPRPSTMKMACRKA